MTDPTPTPDPDPQPDDECANCPHVRAVHAGACTAASADHRQTTESDVVICHCPGFIAVASGHGPADQLERVQVLDLQTGDIIIGTLPPGCTTALASAIATDLERRFPHHDRVILPAGVGLHLVRPARTSLVGSLPPGWRLDVTDENTCTCPGGQPDPQCPQHTPEPDADWPR